MKEENQIQIINSAEAVEAINRSEIDIAIATAKKFPRDIQKAKDEILSLATCSRETAESCFYHLPRYDKKQKKNIDIIGPSVRLAEIIAYSWTNINAGFRVVGNDGKKITAQAIAYDIERNHREGAEVSQGITYSDGKTYTEDLQIMIMNSAGSKAWRNAIFKLIPNAVWMDIQEKIKTFIVGGEKKTDKKFQDRLTAVMKKFADLGVEEKKICEVLKINSRKDIDRDELIKLYGVLTAINEGSTSVEEVFNIKSQTAEGDFSDDQPDGEQGKSKEGKLEFKT